MKKRIGVFDSGLGGLTVLKQLIKYLPNEDYFYLGDNARVPYGIKSDRTIIHYSEQAVDFLLEKDVEIIVIACNTASAIALSHLEKKYPDITFVGMIQSAVNGAAELSKGTVGVIGTDATVKSKAYYNGLKEKGLDIIQTPCPLFVPLVESGLSRFKDAAKIIADEYLKDIKSSKADSLILACTHYPFLKDLISNILPDLKIIDTGEYAAKYLRSILDDDSNDQGSIQYFVTDEPNNFIDIARTGLGLNIEKVDIVDLES